MIYVLVLVTFYYTDGIHEEGSICQVREEDFDARFMKKLKSPWENIYSKTEVDELLNAKQNTLIEGTGIDIDEDDEISCTVEPSAVSVTQVQTTGTKIATIDVDGVDTDIYAPAASGGLDEDVIADEFDTTPIVTPNVYNQNDFCTHSGYVYVCTKDNTTSEPAWGASGWQQAGTSVITSFPAWVDQYGVFKSGSTYYQNTGAGVFAQSARDITSKQQVNDRGAWSSGTSTYHQYSAGDFCMHEGGLYKCTASTTGQSWVAAKWSATQVTDELGGGGSGSEVIVLDLYNELGSSKISFANLVAESGGDPGPSNTYYCSFKVGSSSKTLSAIAAALEAGTVIIKDTDSCIGGDITIDPSHGYLSFVATSAGNETYIYTLYGSSGIYNFTCKAKVQLNSSSSGASTLSALTDTNISSPSNGQVLTYDGTKWKNATPSGGGSATAFTIYNQSGSNVQAFATITEGTAYTLKIGSNKKSMNDLKTAFEAAGAIIADANNEEVRIISLSVNGRFSIIANTSSTSEMYCFTFAAASGNTYQCTAKKRIQFV